MNDDFLDLYIFASNHLLEISTYVLLKYENEMCKRDRATFRFAIEQLYDVITND